MPISSASSTAGQNGTPQSLTAEASTTVISAMAEPGERSIPPEKMTIVDPTAMIATIETCSTRLFRLPKSTKVGVVSATTSATIRQAADGPAISLSTDLFMPPDRHDRVP